jgi:hypothetical protein
MGISQQRVMPNIPAAQEPRYLVRTTISATAADGLMTMRAPPRQAAE